MAWCLASWWGLATIYFLPVWLGGFFGNRDLNFRQSWRLAGAALMPGALVMIATIVAYGFGVLDLVQVAAAVVAHFLVGWVYVFWGAWVTPKISANAVPVKNPFVTAPEKPITKQPENPFAKSAQGEHPTSNIQQPTSNEGETSNAER
jgi:hypothetical protein